MIIDSSAIVALIQGEQPHSAQVAAALAGARGPVMSAPAVAECLIVLTARHGPVARTIFERLRSEIGLTVAHFTDDFGDCMTYAAARLSDEPLLAVGNDFPQTDLEFRGIVGYWPTPSTTT